MSNFRHLISSALSFSNRRIRFRHTGAGRRNTAPKPSENESLVTILQNTYDLTTCLPSTCSSSSLQKNTKAAARVRTTAFSCHGRQHFNLEIPSNNTDVAATREHRSATAGGCLHPAARVPPPPVSPGHAVRTRDLYDARCA